MKGNIDKIIPLERRLSIRYRKGDDGKANLSKKKGFTFFMFGGNQ